MKKNIVCFLLFLFVMLLALSLNILCIFQLLSYKYWRLSLAGILVLLGIIWFFVSRIRKTDEEFEMIYTPSQKVIMQIIILLWGITFFGAIF